MRQPNRAVASVDRNNLKYNHLYIRLMNTVTRFQIAFTGYYYITNWLVDRRPTDRPTDRLTGRLTDRLTGCPTNWLTNQLTLCSCICLFNIYISSFRSEI